MTVQALKKLLNGKILELPLISDPSHGWLKIPKALSFGLTFSKFSYQDKTHLYLEEDCDMSKYLDHLHEAGIKTSFEEKTSNTDSYIRDLERVKN